MVQTYRFAEIYMQDWSTVCLGSPGGIKTYFREHIKEIAFFPQKIYRCCVGCGLLWAIPAVGVKIAISEPGWPPITDSG